MIELIRALLSSDHQSSPLLSKANQHFLAMLDQTSELLSLIEPQVLDNHLATELRSQVRGIDKASNTTERSIRKLLIETLSFERSDAPLCLILMSVAKDAERMIDECRNLIEVGDILGEQAMPAGYISQIREQIVALISLLGETREAFANNDEVTAVHLVENEKPFLAKIAHMQDTFLDDVELNNRQAVSLSRCLRYIQRIRSHLGNIASTVIFPVHQIDFAKSAFLAEAKQRLGMK